MTSAVNPKSPVHIRSATKADVMAMIAVVNAAFAIESFLVGTRTDEQRMEEMLQKGEFVIAEDEAGTIVACVYVERRGERGYFGMLAVDPARQGIGLGRAMVEAAEDRCRESGCTNVDISVLSLRTELLPLYRNLGYSETGVEVFHPSRPLKEGVKCHSIVLSKKL